MRVYWFAISALAAWRVTHLLQAEDGPWDAIVRLRRALGNGMAGRLLDCFYCLSLWIAAPLAAIASSSWKEWLLTWPALSGAAILLERVTTRREEPEPPASYVEDEEDSNVLRRSEESGSADGVRRGSDRTVN